MKKKIAEKKVDNVEKTSTHYFNCVRNLLSAKLGCMMGSFKKTHEMKQWRNEIRQFKIRVKGEKNA